MPRPSLRAVSRWALALLFVGAGVNHFVRPDGYASIVPPWLPAGFPSPLALVYLSGVAEVALGLLVLTRWRKWAGWGLVALLVAVYPANVHMAMEAAADDAPAGYQTLLWLRLPLQGVLVGWVWRACVGVPDGRRARVAA